MSFAKELLFSCIVMMHVSFVVMRPLDMQPLCKSLKDLGLAVGNLHLAEQKYVKLILSDVQPVEYKLNTWRRSDGITFGNTTDEIQASVCAIIDYLGNHLPNITRSLTTGNQSDPIIDNANGFLDNFKVAVRPTVKVTECKQREIETSDVYARKVMGLHIMYSSRQWVEHFRTDC